MQVLVKRFFCAVEQLLLHQEGADTMFEIEKPKSSNTVLVDNGTFLDQQVLVLPLVENLGRRF
jgi:hypothetical protein